MELEVPYGLRTGYANLFYVTPAFRGLGFAQALHERAVLYCRSWEADRDRAALLAGQRAGDAFLPEARLLPDRGGDGGVLWRMAKDI